MTVVKQAVNLQHSAKSREFWMLYLSSAARLTPLTRVMVPKNHKKRDQGAGRKIVSLLLAL